MKAHRGSRGIALLFNLGTRWWWMVNTTSWPFYRLGRSPGMHCIEGWVSLRASLSGQVWKIMLSLGFDPWTVQLYID
jgi:hypothetical protein